MPSSIDDPERWREWAASSRSEADQMIHLESRRALLRIAQLYEHLASEAEGLAAGGEATASPEAGQTRAGGGNPAG